MHLVIFDLETTGYSPRYHEIIQIAAVRMRHGAILAHEHFATFVRPRSRIPQPITGLTGITEEDVREAPEPAACLAAFSHFVGDATVMAHNGHRFDIPFLRHHTSVHGLPAREVPYLDSMELSRRLWPAARSHNLDAVIERLGISTAGLHRHDARADVRVLAVAVVAMWQSLGVPSNCCPVPMGIGHLPR